MKDKVKTTGKSPPPQYPPPPPQYPPPPPPPPPPEGQPAGEISKNTTRLVIIIVSIFAFALVTAIIAAIAIPALLNAKRAAYQNTARETLRSIGSCQSAYQNTNAEKRFGTYGNLKKYSYIAEGYTLGNMIDYYSVSWEVKNHPPFTGSTLPREIEIPPGNSFTIIAFPRDTRPGYLNTYGITENQILYVFNPENNNNPDNVETWDPIL